MSLTGKDNEGNEINASLSRELQELQELRTDKRVMEMLEPMSKKLDETYNTVLIINEKVRIHNTYEERFKCNEAEIKSISKNQWRVLGIWTAITVIIGFLVFELNHIL